MKNRRNYYRLLQVQPDAPFEVVRSSFRALMRDLRHHPDLGGSDGDAALINEAYETLNNPKRRNEYDRKIHIQYTRRSTAARTTPLPRTEEEHAERANRRSVSRMKKDERINISHYTDGSQRTEAQMIDFSPGGMLLRCNEQLSVESLITINCSLLHATACVTHCRERIVGSERRFSIGVTFIAVSFQADHGALLSAII